MRTSLQGKDQMFRLNSVDQYRLRNLFRRLDSSAEIVEQSLLDLLLHPIQWEERIERRPVSDLTSLNRKYRRQKQ